MPKNDSGAAFPPPINPLPIRDGLATFLYNTSGDGMTLRDWFAGQALVGNIANHELTWPKYPTDLAADCYAISDAMVAEKKKREDAPAPMPSDELEGYQAGHEAATTDAIKHLREQGMGSNSRWPTNLLRHPILNQERRLTNERNSRDPHQT